ncbi:16S rRNA (guanine(527)-N(7))-methyltransferase RsmG [bacterium]|nr:16S rRNA (guanine(527)-N(7))-methyltransferase RsmG [bacterium]
MQNVHNLESVVILLQQAGVQVEAQQQELLQRYVDLLLDWNSRINLISRKDQEQVWRNHMLHSLIVLAQLPMPREGWITDIGSGGGLPGIPLAILLPGVQFLLVDSVGKKIRTVQEMASALELPNVRTVHGRVEDDVVLGDYAGKADIVTARAVTRLEALLRWARPLLRTDGPRRLVVWKGGDLTEEITEARRNPVLGGIEEISMDIPGEEYFRTEEKKLLNIRYR